MSEQREELLEELRPPAFAIAYRMLSSMAEDIVQEALLRHIGPIGDLRGPLTGEVHCSLLVSNQPDSSWQRSTSTQRRK